MSEHFNNLTPAQDELLTLLAEECAEVIQAICKIQRHGYESFDPTDTGDAPTNRRTLTKEMGDVKAAMSILCGSGDIDLGVVHNHALWKLRKVGEWLHHNPQVQALHRGQEETGK